MAQEINFLTINLDSHLEKKGKLDYLPWSVVWREFIQKYPFAHWHVYEFNGLPVCYLKDGTAFVKVGIFTAPQGEEKTCWLPVMDMHNKAIANPNAFEVNKTIMRCLVKAAAMFGLGLNVYNGETFNEANPAPKPEPKPQLTPREWAKQQITLLMTLDKEDIDKWKAAKAIDLERLKAKDIDAYNELMDVAR